MKLDLEYKNMRLLSPGQWDWEFLFRVDFCHKWYRCRDTGWIAVADNSGREPHETDDGVLWLAQDQQIICEEGRPRIELIDDQLRETLLGGTNMNEARELVERGYARFFH